MTDPFIHPPSAAMAVATILFWITETGIALTLLVIGLRDIFVSSRVRDRLKWLQSLTTKKHAIRVLSGIALALGVGAFAMTPVLTILPHWSAFQESDRAFTLRTTLLGGLTIGAMGLIPFTIGQVLLWMYRRVPHIR